MKNTGKRIFRVFYILLLLVLGTGIILGSDYVWSACREYQENSARTVLMEAVDEVTVASGLPDVSYDPVPSVDSNGDSTYKLRNGSEIIGEVKLAVKKKGLLTLALYELKSIRGTKSFEFYAPEGVTVSLRGEKIEPAETLRYYGSDNLRKFKDDRKIPSFYRYEIGELFDIAQIEINCEGRELTESQQLGGKRFIEMRFSEKEANKIKKRAKTIAQKYSNFISTDIKWAELSPEIMSGSQLLTSIPSLEVRWYTAHNGWSMSNVKISEPLCLNSKYALVHISYDYVISRWGTTNSVPTELALYLHKDSDGTWRLAELNLNLYYDFEMNPM